MGWVVGRRQGWGKGPRMASPSRRRLSPRLRHLPGTNGNLRSGPAPAGQVEAAALVTTVGARGTGEGEGDRAGLGEGGVAHLALANAEPGAFHGASYFSAAMRPRASLLRNRLRRRSPAPHARRYQRLQPRTTFNSRSTCSIGVNWPMPWPRLNT